MADDSVYTRECEPLLFLRYCLSPRVAESAANPHC